MKEQYGPVSDRAEALRRVLEQLEASLRELDTVGAGIASARLAHVIEDIKAAISESELCRDDGDSASDGSEQRAAGT